jgi:hypothetical protein
MVVKFSRCRQQGLTILFATNQSQPRITEKKLMRSAHRHSNQVRTDRCSYPSHSITSDRGHIIIANL